MNDPGEATLRLPRQALELISAAPRVVVAYSGGCDSQVLLDMLRRWRSPGSWLLAAHVDHGLSPESGQWLEHCREYCNRHGISFKAEQVDARPPRGASPESYARKLRYAALASCMSPGAVLLLAHHADDQAETMLLQAMRGAGVDGMAAMPFTREFAAGTMVRPLLEISKARILQYARDMDLNWIEDGSNKDLSYDRNYIRHVVIPVLAERWPGAGSTLAAASNNFAAARAMLEDQAMVDIAGAVSGSSIDIKVLSRLDSRRAANAFRYWLRSHDIRAPSAARLGEMLRQFIHASASANPSFHCDDRVLRRYQDRVYLLPQLAAAPGTMEWKLDKPLALALGFTTCCACRYWYRAVSRHILPGQLPPWW